MTGELVGLEAARAEAARLGVRERVVCYVTRESGGVHLLVFEHTSEYPEAGVQVPAGGLDAGEVPAQAASREAAEETGLSGLGAPVYLGSRAWLPAHLPKEHQMRHYYWLRAPAGGRDAWAHAVQPEGLTFLCRFAPLDAHGLDWDLGELLPELARHLNPVNA